MTDARDFGFLPENGGEDNARALQEAVKDGGEITVEKPGVYDLAGTVLLGDDTSLTFAPGVMLRRQRCEGFQGNVFVNRGAFTGVWNKNIRLRGLRLMVNGVESTPASAECDKTVVGLRAHVAFLYVRDLTLTDIEITGLFEKDYGIQISDFRKVRVERIHVEGLKDGIHFGPGRGFVLRDSVFRTFDDPIALNCSDYSVSNPNLGWIEDGLIENCWDLSDAKTTGFFIRILDGAWKDWEKGMTVSQSDAVLHNGKIYRVVMPPDGRTFVSVTPPGQERGFQMLDGITWVRTHLGYKEEELPRSAGCRNITFRDLYLEKNRDSAVVVYFNDDAYLRSYREGAPVPFTEGLVFERIHVRADVKNFLAVCAPVKDITVRDTSLGASKISFQASIAGIPKTRLYVENASFAVRDDDGVAELVTQPE